MRLDQPAPVVQLDQFTVGADLQLVAQVGPRHRVQGFGDLDVEVTMDLHVPEDRHIVRLRDRQQDVGLMLVEDLRRAGVQGAMEPHPGPLGTPHDHAFLSLLEAGELFAGPEVAAHVLHRPFDLRLVFR